MTMPGRKRQPGKGDGSYAQSTSRPGTFAAKGNPTSMSAVTATAKGKSSNSKRKKGY